MKKILLFFIVLLLTVTLVGVAFAAASLTADVYTSDSPDPNANNNGDGFLSIRSSGIPCAVNNEGFLKFDLSGVNGEVSNSPVSSSLDFEVVFGGSSGSGTLELWSVSDGWTETGITHNNKPSPIAMLATISLPLADGVHSFSSNALATYLNQESAFVGGGDIWAGDNTASFAIRVSGCPATGGSLFAFETGGGAGTPAALSLFNPTAVQLSTFQASQGNPSSLVLTVGVVAATTLVAGAFLLFRRKAV